MSKNNKNRNVTFLFGEDGPTSANDLGGKGAGLNELARLGVPVPPGFTVTTSVARAFAQHNELPKRVINQLRRQMSALERETGKSFGDSSNPLLVSVRSGAAVSMPGMMDTVLNLGLNPEIVRALARSDGDRFAFDCYRRFLAMFGDVVLGIVRSAFDEILNGAKEVAGVKNDQDLSASELESVCGQYRNLIERETGQPVVDDPWEQLVLAVVAVLASWNNPRAKAYRRAKKISNNLGTAVNVQSMVYGNRGDDSGTGVVFSRDVAVGTPGLWGEFLVNAQGEDVVAGVRTPMPIAHLAEWNEALYTQLNGIVTALENSRNDVVDVEFTIEAGQLYILQVRSAKRTPEAAATIAVHFVWEKRCSKAEALARVDDEQKFALEDAGFAPDALAQAACDLVLEGLPASPGAAVGRPVFTSEEAVEAAANGESVILCRPDTSPDDLPGMLAAAAIVTTTGGSTCHAAVVARSLGKPAVVSSVAAAGIEGSPIHFLGAMNRPISVDGHSGKVYEGEIERAQTANKKEVNLFLKWIHGDSPKPRLAFEMIEESVAMTKMCADFFLIDEMAAASRRTSLGCAVAVVKSRVHIEVAERIAMYLVIAVAGELRYAENWAECKAELTELKEKFANLHRDDRYRSQLKLLSILKDGDQDPVRFLELAVALFSKGRWGFGMGGMKWAAIAQAALDFLTGAKDHTLFADHAFDLQHNGGQLFDKHRMITGYESEMRSQLERKKYTVEVGGLYGALSPHPLRHGECLCDTARLDPEIEKLFRKGVSLRLWGTPSEDGPARGSTFDGKMIYLGSKSGFSGHSHAPIKEVLHKDYNFNGTLISPENYDKSGSMGGLIHELETMPPENFASVTDAFDQMSWGHAEQQEAHAFLKSTPEQTANLNAALAALKKNGPALPGSGGMLMIGAPGTGKTKMMKHLAESMEPLEFIDSQSQELGQAGNGGQPIIIIDELQ